MWPPISTLGVFFTAVALVLLPAAGRGEAPIVTATYPPPDDQRSPDRTATLTGPAATLLAFSLDGRILASADATGAKIALFNARPGTDTTGALVRTLELGTDRGAKSRPASSAIAFRRGGGALVALAGATVTTFDATTGKAAAVVRLAGLGAQRSAVPAAFHPGNEPVVAVAAGTSVGLWNFETGTALASLPARARVRCLAFAPDGKLLAMGSDAGLRVHDVATGAVVHDLGAPAALRACALSATHLVSGSADGTTRLHPLGEAAPPAVFAQAHRGPVHAVALATKGGEWASAGADGRIVVHDVATRARLCVQAGHVGAVRAVAFNPNGQKLVSAGADRTLRTWTMPLPPLAPGHLDKITAAVPAKARAAPRRPRRVLVFWRADAILHKAGVPAANTAFELMGKKTGAYTAEFSRDVAVFTPAVLARYDAIVFNSTAHLAIDDPAQRRALLDWARAGGGVVGVHAAIDMWKRWPEGAELIGATFAGHPWHPSKIWRVKLDEPEHPLMRAFGGRPFTMQDEFYELGVPYARSDRRVLLSLDTSDPATTAVTPIHRTDGDFAVSWVKRYGAGRVFYCMFGHRAEPFHDPAVLAYYLDGLQWAAGDLDLDLDAGPPAAAATRP